MTCVLHSHPNQVPPTSVHDFIMIPFTTVVVWYSIFPELHADLFSRHASQIYVFVAVANRGGDVVSDEICRRFNGKQQ